MTLLLAAEEKGLSSCWLGALNREELSKILNLPEDIRMLDLIALGYGAQKSVAEPIRDGNIKYYLDEEGILHVPKRTLDETLIKERFA